MGWGPGSGKGSQKYPHLWRYPRKPPSKTNNFFLNFDYKTWWIRRGFEQLSSSIAWRVIGLERSAWNVVFAGLLIKHVNEMPFFSNLQVNQLVINSHILRPETVLLFICICFFWRNKLLLVHSVTKKHNFICIVKKCWHFFAQIFWDVD